ncbi:MAG: PKD domain-containing protein, partial [Thermoplasmata archaeon]
VGVFNAYNASCSAECNASTDGSYGIFSPLLAFAAAEGISVVAASGDCGASDGTSGLSTNFPASDPDVTGVGGTVLTVDAVGDYLSETAWGGNSSGAVSPGCQNQGGTGGGYSPFPRPWWQAGMVRGSTHRGVPDVALDAATPALVVAGGGTAAVGGTSLATPIWAGIASIADQYSGHRLGLLNPSLYAIAAGTNYTHDFHDIESGNNGYPAVPGWDPVTGLGTPRVASLIVNLVGTIPVASSNLTSFVYATPRFGHAPLTVTFHLNITGGTGTFPLEGVSFGDGNASFAPEGAVTYTFAFPGVYSAQAYVADSSANYSVSPPVAIVVGGGTGLTVVLHASAENPAVGAPVLFSATVGGGVAPYEYNFSFGDGTFLDGSLASTASHVFGAVGSFCASVVVADSASPMNGGASQRVAVGVGGAGVPDCRNDTVPLTMTATPDIGVRDAPADFPDLFNVSGGSGAAGTLPPSVQYSTSDPYLAACGCAIFRSSGSYTVTGYGNDSENEETNATTSVTVARHNYRLDVRGRFHDGGRESGTHVHAARLVRGRRAPFGPRAWERERSVPCRRFAGHGALGPGAHGNDPTGGRCTVRNDGESLGPDEHGERIPGPLRVPLESWTGFRSVPIGLQLDALCAVPGPWEPDAVREPDRHPPLDRNSHPHGIRPREFLGP